VLQQPIDFVFVMSGPGFLEAIDLALDVGALSIVSQAFQGPDTVGGVRRRPRLAGDLRDQRAFSFT
jgi:hypothetical protein